jgi:hypothetical protein
LYVEGSPRLAVTAVVPGRLLDVAADRMLYLFDDGTDAPPLRIGDRSSGQDTPIELPLGVRPHDGYLSPGGAIFVAGPSDRSTFPSVYRFSRGALTVLEPPDSCVSLFARGNDGIWTARRLVAQADTIALVRRDLVAGIDVDVASARLGYMGVDVAANGDVVYGTETAGSYKMHRYRAGATTQTSAGGTLSSVSPLRDATDVVYVRQTPPPCCTPGSYAIILHYSGAELSLTPMQLRSSPRPGLDYQVHNGYAAFTRDDGVGASQVWLRGPDGTLTQLSFFGSTSSIDGLAPTGELTFLSGGRRYLAGPGRPALDSGASFGKSHYLGGDGTRLSSERC